MKKNMGNIDRLIRFMLAVILGMAYYAGAISGTLGLVLMAVATVFLLTSSAGVCPLYSALGIRTCSVEDNAV